jgi:hypothetical protein
VIRPEVGVASNDVTVRFEPCETFMVGPDPTAGTCSECGWFEEDHWFAELERTRRLPVREVALTGTA